MKARDAIDICSEALGGDAYEGKVIVNRRALDFVTAMARMCLAHEKTLSAVRLLEKGDQK
jgi:hypothetical protein